MFIRICLICLYMQASAGQHLPVLSCIYLYLLVFALSLLSCGTERSEAERGRSSLLRFQVVEASVAKQSEAALNYMLGSVRKCADIGIRARNLVSILSLFWELFSLLCFGSVFDMGDIRNVHELGSKHV